MSKWEQLLDKNRKTDLRLQYVSFGMGTTDRELGKPRGKDFSMFVYYSFTVGLEARAYMYMFVDIVARPQCYN